MSECWLYKAYRLARDKDVLLYVGISDSPDDRMSQHCRDKWWWHLVEKLEWYKLENRDVAAANEQKLIACDRPLFNKKHSVLTAGEVLLGCLDLISYSFRHCPICHTACLYSEVDWSAKGLCLCDVGEPEDAFCFEVLMSCSSNHTPIEWTQFVPIQVLAECSTRMPEKVLADLWHQADQNGEVSEDIEPLRAPTLVELFAVRHEVAFAKTALLESK